MIYTDAATGLGRFSKPLVQAHWEQWCKATGTVKPWVHVAAYAGYAPSPGLSNEPKRCACGDASTNYPSSPEI